MSTDTFEDTLRILLLDTVDAETPAYLEPDADGVIGRGRRIVRRRRYAAGMVVVGVAGIAGIAGIAALGTGSQRTSTLAKSSSTAQWTTSSATADLTRGAMLGDTWGPAEGRPSVRVSVDLEQRSWTSSLIGGEGELSGTASTSLPADPRIATWTSRPGPAGLVSGVLPAAATQVVFVWDGDPGDGTQAMQPLYGTPYQAFARWHERGRDEPAQLAGLVWTDRTTVYNSWGAEVRSAHSGTALVYVDQSLGVFGIFEDGTTSTKRLTDVPEGAVPTLMTGLNDGSDTVETTLFLVLPAGAARVNVGVLPGATLHSSQAYDGGTTGETLVVARLTVPTTVVSTGVDQVTWTNADGSTGSGAVG